MTINYYKSEQANFEQRISHKNSEHSQMEWELNPKMNPNSKVPDPHMKSHMSGKAPSSYERGSYKTMGTGYSKKTTLTMNDYK
jgi:hypothetical protein